MEPNMPTRTLYEDQSDHFQSSDSLPLDHVSNMLICKLLEELDSFMTPDVLTGIRCAQLSSIMISYPWGTC